MLENPGKFKPYKPPAAEGLKRGVCPAVGGETGASCSIPEPEAGEGLDCMERVSVEVFNGDGERERLSFGGGRKPLRAAMAADAAAALLLLCCC